MADLRPEDIRNVIVVSHSGAGKTSLVDALLFNAGANSRQGKVEDGTSLSDYDEEEIERRISINASSLHCSWKGKKINLIDTPGYADFIGEVFASLRVADAAVLVVDAVSGIEVGTRKVWDLLEEKKLPRLVFVNKMEKENADFFRVVESLRKGLGERCTAFQYPLGRQSSYQDSLDLLTGDPGKLPDGEREKFGKMREALVEAVCGSNDALIEKYLGGGELSPQELEAGVKTGISSGGIVPVLCGSALKNAAMKPVLDLIAGSFPSPAELPGSSGTVPGSAEPQTRKAAAGEPLSAFVFKSVSDPYVGQLTFFRVCSGVLKSNGDFYNFTRKTKEKYGQLFSLQGKEQVPVEKIVAGDIGGLAKLKETRTNDSFGDAQHPIVFDPIVFPEPAISVSIKPKARTDEEKISQSLDKLSTGDPTFHVSRDPQTKEMIASGVGDLQLEIMINRLRRKFGVNVDVGIPKVAYKETITRKIKAQGKFKRQTGGRGQYGDCWLELEPRARSGGYEFIDRIVGGVIPRQYIPSVEKGVKEAMESGILAGYPVVDLEVSVCDGSYHDVDSSDMAFKIAGSMAFKAAMEKAGPVLLEPIMEVEVMVPDDCMGSITGDINARRGRIMGMDSRAGMQVVKAHIPLGEMLKYATELRSMTGGRGYYQMKFSRYEEVPAKISQIIIAEAKRAKEAQQ